MKKKASLFLVFVFISSLCNASENKNGKGKIRQDIKTLNISRQKARDRKNNLLYNQVLNVEYADCNELDNKAPQLMELEKLQQNFGTTLALSKGRTELTQEEKEKIRYLNEFYFHQDCNGLYPLLVAEEHDLWPDELNSDNEKDPYSDFSLEKTGKEMVQKYSWVKEEQEEKEQEEIQKALAQEAEQKQLIADLQKAEQQKWLASLAKELRGKDSSSSEFSGSSSADSDNEDFGSGCEDYGSNGEYWNNFSGYYSEAYDGDSSSEDEDVMSDSDFQYSAQNSDSESFDSESQHQRSEYNQKEIDKELQKWEKEGRVLKQMVQEKKACDESMVGAVRLHAIVQKTKKQYGKASSHKGKDFSKNKKECAMQKKRERNNQKKLRQKERQRERDKKALQK